MKPQNPFLFLSQLLLALLAPWPTIKASTIWNGPDVGFYHPYGGAADQMTANVVLTRGDNGGLYNSTDEASATAGVSPEGTEWAIGTLSQFTNNVHLDFEPCPLEAGNSPPGYINTTFVVYLIHDDVYLELTLTNWGGAGGAFHQQTFGYTRSTPPIVVSTPSVTITNPVSGATFAAPATVMIQTSATNGSGPVTNVQFFTNNVSIGSVAAAPFDFMAGNLPAGSYALQAVATSGGISGTSAVVNINVVTPLAVALGNSAVISTNFQFSYPANVGLRYVVQVTTNLNPANWISLATNVAASNPVVFVDDKATNFSGYYRVGRLPNP